MDEAKNLYQVCMGVGEPQILCQTADRIWKLCPFSWLASMMPLPTFAVIMAIISPPKMAMRYQNAILVECPVWYFDTVHIPVADRFM